MLRMISGVTLCVIALAAGCGNVSTMTGTKDLGHAADLAGTVADMIPPADMAMPPTITPPTGCNTATVVTGTTAYSTLAANNRCMGQTCHNMAQLPTFKTQASFMTSMVNQQSSSDFKYVMPSQPNNSYILYKLRNMQLNVPNGNGGFMPENGTQLNDTDFCVIYNWILHGAPTT